MREWGRQGWRSAAWLTGLLLWIAASGCGPSTAPDPTAGKPRPLAAPEVEVRTMPVTNPDPTYHASCQTGGIVLLKVGASHDPEGQPVVYEWSDVVNGEPSADLRPRPNPYRTSEPEMRTGLYTIGIHTITLTVTAADGRKASAALQVLVTSCEICGT